jgi:GNAT superfamily N-acetyltransferase
MHAHVETSHPAFHLPPVPATGADPGQRPERFEVVLRDGAHAVLRPLEPGDRRALEELYLSLSPESRRLRFFTPAPTLDRSQMRFVLGADGDRHVAWGAFRKDRLVAVARYVCGAGRRLAELAATVADHWQGRGLGGLLLEALAADADARGIERFSYSVLGDNRKALRLLTSFGGRMRWSSGMGEGELPVAAFRRERLTPAAAFPLASGW